MSVFRKYELQFFTATILNWQHLLDDDANKDIIMSSLRFLVQQERVSVAAFCIMSNHIHLLWQIKPPHVLEDVQRDFLRYTSQQMIKEMRNHAPEKLDTFRVDAKDRKYQIWERNALSIDVWTEDVLLQKLNYIHQNPVKASLCKTMTGYKYSSATFYDTGNDEFGVLSHYRF